MRSSCGSCGRYFTPADAGDVASALAMAAGVCLDCAEDLEATGEPDRETEALRQRMVVDEAGPGLEHNFPEDGDETYAEAESDSVHVR